MFICLAGYLSATPQLQVPPPVPTAVVRQPVGIAVPRPGLEYGSYTAPYPPSAGQPTSIYQPSQQQMFAPTPGTFTPDIYR